MKSQYREPEKLFVVENVAQKVLMLSELLGQISDGYWENSRPSDHYLAWSNVEIMTAEEAGRAPGVYDFYTWRKYNFAAKSLLDIVGDRMLFKAKFAILCPDIYFALVAIGYGMDSVDALRKAAHYALYDNTGYSQEQIAKLEAAGVTQEILDEVDASDCYTMADMRKDLRALSKLANAGRW